MQVARREPSEVLATEEKKDRGLISLLHIQVWKRVQTGWMIFRSRALRKRNVRDASFKKDAEANLNKRLEEIMRPKAVVTQQQAHRRAVFRLEGRRIVLAMRVCTAQLSHRFVGFEGRDERSVEELGAIVGMSVASNARAMAPLIERPVRATALISRVPGNPARALRARRGRPSQP
jgi:hypothetical protein